MSAFFGDKGFPKRVRTFSYNLHNHDLGTHWRNKDVAALELFELLYGHALRLRDTLSSGQFARTSAVTIGGQTLLPHIRTCSLLVIGFPLAPRSMM
jgi:hypothetical protein